MCVCVCVCVCAYCPQEEGSAEAQELVLEADTQLTQLRKSMKEWKIKKLLSGPYDDSVGSDHLYV